MRGPTGKPTIRSLLSTFCDPYRVRNGEIGRNGKTTYQYIERNTTVSRNAADALFVV